MRAIYGKQMSLLNHVKQRNSLDLDKMLGKPKCWLVSSNKSSTTGAHWVVSSWWEDKLFLFIFSLSPWNPSWIWSYNINLLPLPTYQTIAMHCHCLFFFFNFHHFTISNSLPHFPTWEDMKPGAEPVVGNPQGLSDWYWSHGGWSRCKQVSRHYQRWKIPQRIGALFHFYDHLARNMIAKRSSDCQVT